MDAYMYIHKCVPLRLPLKGDRGDTIGDAMSPGDRALKINDT